MKRVEFSVWRRVVVTLVVAILAAGALGCSKPKEPQNPAEVRKKLAKVVKLVLWKVDAADAQKKKVDALLDELSVDLFAVQTDNDRIVRRAMDALDAEVVDMAALERVAVDGTALFERYLRRMIRAAVDLTKVTTDAQRHELVKMWRQWEFGSEG